MPESIPCVFPIVGLARKSIPFALTTIRAGFPSPADDYLQNPLDFTDHLVQNQAATFAVRVDGDSMIGDGIFPGDLLVVDKTSIHTTAVW